MLRIRFVQAQATRPPIWQAARQNEMSFAGYSHSVLYWKIWYLTGLRGIGKTVLLDSFKPLAMAQGWIWIGTDLSESVSISEKNMAVRLCTDLALITATWPIATHTVPRIGFNTVPETVSHTLTYQTLMDIYDATPGLALDKLKQVLATVWETLSQESDIRGIIFAYDEAQNLADQASKNEFPLSLLLDCFQSLQRQGLPLMLVLTGLPTLFPKLVDTRTFSERMFRVLFLKKLTQEESKQAIQKPVEDVTLSRPTQYGFSTNYY